MVATNHNVTLHLDDNVLNKQILQNNNEINNGSSSSSSWSSEMILKHFINDLSMSSSKAQEVMKNPRLSKRLQLVLQRIDESGFSINKAHANLIKYWCENVKDQFWEHSLIFINYIVDDKIDTRDKVDYAIKFLTHSKDNNFSKEDFEKSIGIGFEMSDDELLKNINIIKAEESLYHNNISRLKSAVFHKLKFVDRLRINHLIDAIFNHTIDYGSSKKPTCRTYADLFKDQSKFHKVGENHTTSGYIIKPNTFELIKEHLKRTDHRVITRFPPEPNGLLHIGHAKAIILDFGFAQYNNGITYLRFDDTNPEKEEERFMREIINIIHWMGYKPYKITYSSDYFQQLYDFAVKLIKKNLAYVCHQTREEMKAYQDSDNFSPYRDRSIEENLTLFEQMRQGLIEEGKAVLRMKYRMSDGKIDPVVYRIKFKHHVRTGNEWCIYPSYDFSHPICDSLEDITHSMCTKEFQNHRPLYYWLCTELDLYCPVQWEFSRLNLTHSVLSKRKIQKLIANGICDDWDDPRLFTLSALRRRGVTPNALYKFCQANSVTMAQTFISPLNLNHFIREDLNATSPRAIGILEPLKVIIVNYDEFCQQHGSNNLKYSFNEFPMDKNSKKSSPNTYSLILKPTIYIDSQDFRLNENSPEYHRLTGVQPVGLLYTDLQITFIEYQTSDNPKKTCLLVNVKKNDDKDNNINQPKSSIQWLSDPLICEIRIFNNLFVHEFPEKEDYGGYMNDLNPKSIEIYDHAFVEKRLANCKVGDKFQFIRIGYFCVDKDSSDIKLVLNLTVSLREDRNKN